MFDKVTAFNINSLDDGSLDIKASGIEQYPITDNQGAATVIAGNPVQPSFSSEEVVTAARALVAAIATEHAAVHKRNTATIGADGALVQIAAVLIDSPTTEITSPA